METILSVIRLLVVSLPALGNFAAAALAQEVNIPDPGLDAAIRQALQKPGGPLAATNLAATVASLQNQGVSVFTYPLAVQLVRPLELVGAFNFGIVGPPGAYTIFESVDLANWSVLGITTNTLGAINFTDVTAHLASRKFYRAQIVQ